MFAYLIKYHRKSACWSACKTAKRIFSHCLILFPSFPFSVYIVIPLLINMLFISLFTITRNALGKFFIKILYCSYAKIRAYKHIQKNKNVNI